MASESKAHSAVGLMGYYFMFAENPSLEGGTPLQEANGPGCAAGWGRIFTTGVTIIGSHFQLKLLEWGRKFSDFWSK